MGNSCLKDTCPSSHQSSLKNINEINKQTMIQEQSEIQESKQEISRIDVKASGVEDSLEISLNSFQFIKQIGKGSFGKVYLVRKKSNNNVYALKILQKNKIDSYDKYKHTKLERKLLENLNHHYLVNLRYAFQSPVKLYLVMDFVIGGELYQHIQRNGPLDPKRCKFYIAEILIALDYLHSKNIVYRDLKPENVLIDGTGHVRLTDFGLAKELLADDTLTYTLCGTPEYIAPEVLKKQGYNRMIDYWTLGVLLYEMLTRQTPFRGKTKQEIFINILQKPVIMREDFDEPTQDFIKKLLVGDPAQRLGKNGVEEVKNHIYFDEINWPEVYNKTISPPWVPELNDQEDLTYFDQKLVNQSNDMPHSFQDHYSNGKVDKLNFSNFTLDQSKLKLLNESYDTQKYSASKQDSKLSQQLLTNSVIKDNNMEQNSHLKEEKQSTVVQTEVSDWNI